MRQFPKLRTQRCTLVQPSSADAQQILETIIDSESQRFLPELHSVFHDYESVMRFIKIFDNYWSDGIGILWTIRLKTFVIGFIGIIDIPHNSTLFYAIHPRYRKQHYMTECVHECINYFTQTYRDTPLHTEVYNENIASRKILVKYSVNLVLKAPIQNSMETALQNRNNILLLSDKTFLS